MKRYTRELFEDINDSDLINEFMDRFDKTGKNEFIEDVVRALEERGYVILFPKYMLKKQMLEDFITENNIND